MPTYARRVAVQEREQVVGGFYHVTLRGARQLPIYFDDRDRRLFLSLLKRVVRKFGWRCYAWCLMDNHFHLLIELTRPSLSNGMFTLNYAYACWLNRRHGYKGHAFDRRFGARWIETTPHLLGASRYIVLNPVRAGVCPRPEDHPWSSYRGLVGLEPPLFEESEWLLAQFGQTRERAIENYIAFVEDALEASATSATKA
jgi:REP element-mobilizing transposase RayT